MRIPFFFLKGSNFRSFLIFFCVNRFFERIHKNGARNRGKTEVDMWIYTAKQSEYRKKQLKKFIFYFYRTVFKLEQTQSIKLEHKLRQDLSTKSKHDMNSGVILWAFELFAFSIEKTCNNYLFELILNLVNFSQYLVVNVKLGLAKFLYLEFCSAIIYYHRITLLKLNIEFFFK